jgi:hypothetical protein
MAHNWIGKWAGHWFGKWLGTQGPSVSSIPPVRVHLYFAPFQSLALPAAVAEITLDFTAPVTFSTPPMRAIALSFQPITEVAL